MHCLKVDLYVFDEIEDLVGGIQAGLNSADHEPHVNISNFFMPAVHLEDQENGGRSTEFRGPLGSRGHERTLDEEGAQAVKGEVLHAEHPSQGTEADVPEVEAILTGESLSGWSQHLLALEGCG